MKHKTTIFSLWTVQNIEIWQLACKHDLRIYCLLVVFFSMTSWTQTQLTVFRFFRTSQWLKWQCRDLHKMPIPGVFFGVIIMEDRINPIPSMYGIFTCIYHKDQPTVGKYIIPGWYGMLDQFRYTPNAPQQKLDEYWTSCSPCSAW